MLTTDIQDSVNTLPYKGIVADSNSVETLTEIYDPSVNIAIWRRQLSTELRDSVSKFIASSETLQLSDNLTPENALERLQNAIGHLDGGELLSKELANIVEMFCCLFEMKAAGLRLTKLEHAMCPRFHVDKVPCRLITTFQGNSTEWLHHSDVDRTKLGHGNNGLPDHESGIYENSDQIQRLNPGDIALLKGEKWEGNEGFGLVHRSPQLQKGEDRLLLTLDFVS